MHDQRLAVHRTIVVVDVEGFGDQCRTNRDQLSIRDGLYRAMRDAFGRAGIPWGDCGHEDRGDGVFILVPAEVPKGLLAEVLPSALVTALRMHNGAHPGPERIRLRMALHAGEVYYDEHGVTAAAVNLAFRLLDAGALRAALASSSGVLAVIASSWFYEEVIRHSAGVSVYRPFEVAVKETTTTGGICLPDERDPAGGGVRAGWPRGHLADKKVLVVLDDAAGSDQVRPLLPGAAGCLVLVTSRRRLTALEEAAPISLGTLSPGEAAGLFARLAGHPGLQTADDAVAEVTGLCGRLPLAIRLVAAGLRHHPAR